MLNKNFIIILSLLIALVSCGTDKKSCIKNVSVYSNRKLPMLDVIKFSLNYNDFNTFNPSNIERVFFIKNKDTIDKIGFIKTEISLNQISFYYRTTKYISYIDSLEIKNEFRSQKIIILMKNKEIYELINCINK